MKGVAAVRDVHRAVQSIQADRAACCCDDLWMHRRSSGRIEQEKTHDRDREADEARAVDREQHDLESEGERQHHQRRPEAQLDVVRLRRVAAVARPVCQCDAEEEERHRAE